MHSSRTLALLSATLLLFFAAPSGALACKCLQRPVDERLATSRVVFRGTVIEARPLGAGRTEEAMTVRYRFDVGRVWKGTNARSFEVSSGTISAACGMTFDIGREYIVYANGGDDDSLSTNLCAGNVPTGNDFATSEIAELDRLAGNSLLLEQRAGFVIGAGLGVTTVINDQWQSGPIGEIWGRYHFTSRSFVRARLAYAPVESIQIGTAGNGIGPHLFLLGLEGGLHLGAPARLSPYLTLGSIVSTGSVDIEGAYFIDPEDAPAKVTFAPSIGFGLELRSATLPILYAEIGGATTFGSAIPDELFSDLLAVRIGASW